MSGHDQKPDFKEWAERKGWFMYTTINIDWVKAAYLEWFEMGQEDGYRLGHIDGFNAGCIFITNNPSGLKPDQEVRDDEDEFYENFWTRWANNEEDSMNRVLENKEKELLKRVDRLFGITKHVETSKEFEAVFRDNFWDLLA